MVLCLVAGGFGAFGLPGGTVASRAAGGLPPIHHVFVIVLENEDNATTFGSPPPAPYLATTMVSEGAYLPNYYGVGHNSLDNYIAMISGQAPNPSTQADCATYTDVTPAGLASDGQETGTGCVYPTDVPTIADQLTAAGLTWGSYDESMGNDPTRDNTTPAGTCGHPVIGTADDTQTETPTDAYATRHNPFMYFHSIIDTAACDNVVNLNQLPTALASAATTPNYVFITPDLCSDGHDATCADATRPGGFAGINAFLSKWIPTITASPAYADGGLIITTFDEGAGGEAGSCCGETLGPTQTVLGGGQVGAVLLSPYIAPGTVSTTPYNHYSMLASVEDLLGLPRLGFAQGTTAFGSDVFTQPNGPPKTSSTTTSSTKTAAVTTKTTTSTTSTGHVVAVAPCVVPKLAKAKHGKLPARALLRGPSIVHSRGKALIQFTAVRRESVSVRARPRHGKLRALATTTAVACRQYRYPLPAGHGAVTIRAAVSAGAATVTKTY
jgi:hypothetical protein